jgi:uncharacterized protein with FMN-binding domain
MIKWKQNGGISMANMSKKWIILCSTAIGALYATDYLATDAQAMMQQTQQHSQSASSTNAGLYKDGTYQGSGSNRRGSIAITLTIKNDKITDVEISNYHMHYSVDDVLGMPQEVLDKQSSQLNNVSGATYSTNAFEDAIQDALNQALNQ